MADRRGSRARDTAELEDRLRDLKADELRERAKEAGISGVSGMRKDELVHAVADADQGGRAAGDRSSGSAGGSRGTSSHGTRSHGKDGQGSARPGGRPTGERTSRSLRYSQEITSPEDRPERPGRSLVTTSHEVITQWAQERDAVPATVAGTEHGDRLGVLRFDFGAAGDSGSAGSSDGPQGSGSRLRAVGWDEWFATFDERRLNFIYQEERSDGRPSNFFRLESPDRQDA